MYYFDNKTLQQYLDSGQSIEIYVNSDIYKVSSIDDVKNPKVGFCYDEFGEAHKFDYRSIEKIKIGSQYLTIDGLQKQKTGEEPPEKDAPKKDSEGGEDEVPDEEPKGGKGPDLSWFAPSFDVGRTLMNELAEWRKLNKK